MVQEPGVEQDLGMVQEPGTRQEPGMRQVSGRVQEPGRGRVWECDGTARQGPGIGAGA